MRFFLLFLAIPLLALEIVVNTTNNYSILNITNNQPFMCKRKNNSTYICKFSTLPSTPVFATNTIDFSLSPFFNKNNFYLKIKVKNKSFIKAFKKNLYEGYYKRLTKLTIAKKWVIISYKKKMPFLSNKPIKGLKFPLEIKNDFYLKAIDANGNPINYDSQTADVVEYFTILKLANKNTLSLDRVNQFIQNYKNSIFLPDVLYLKIKLLDEAGESDKVIKLANLWMKNYSFNEHLPEILLILAKNYANQGMIEDATYIYERLFTEYENTDYAYKGMIYLGDELYSAGDNKRAFELYKKAFTNTKNLEVASLAASRLAQRYLDEGNIKESLVYYNKLFKANKEFLLRDINKAYSLAIQLANHNAYNLAIKIGEELLKKLNQDDNLYEPLLYKLTLWSYEDNKFKLTKKYIDTYLKIFPYGDYVDQIKEIKNKILFEITDKNTTLMLERYNNILKKYPDTDLAKKALLKKINLLYKLKKYKQLLDIKQLTDINKTMLNIATKDLIIKNFKSKNCSEAIKYYKDFNITLPKKYDDELYNCAFKTRNFNIASVVCNKYLLSDNKTALKWLKNKAKVFEATNNYQKLALIIDDICNLQKTNCYKWRYKQFFAYYKLNKPTQFLKIAANIENNNIKNIDIFMKVVSYGLKTNDTLLTYTYAKKVLKLEKLYNTYIQSPYIDFVFVNSAKKLNKKEEAIKTLKHLIKLQINQEAKARAYYMLASLTSKKIYLQKCIKLKKSKTWMPLCKDSLELYND